MKAIKVYVVATIVLMILSWLVVLAASRGIISGDLAGKIIWSLGSFFPFFWLFCLLNFMFHDPGRRPRESDYDWVRIVGWGFILCVIVYFYLLFKFNLFGWKGVFLASVPCLLLPGVAYVLLRPLYRRYIHAERMDADRIASIAFEHKPFADFIAVAGKVRIFATDTEKQYRYARVHALHRHIHPQEPPVIQDTVFEVQVDMRRKQVVEGSEVFQTYLFRPEEEKCPVLVLPIRLEDWHPGDPSVADKVATAKLDAALARFPNLDRYPLPIASRNKEAVEIPWGRLGHLVVSIDRDRPA